MQHMLVYGNGTAQLHGDVLFSKYVKLSVISYIVLFFYNFFLIILVFFCACFFFRVQVVCYTDISLTLIDVLTILNSNSMAYEEIGNSVFVFSKRLTFYRHKGSGKKSS